MELYVLSDRQLDSIAACQRAIDAEGFALRLSAETPFEALNGILPVQLGDRRTAFECVHWDAGVLMAENPDIEFAHRWRHALALRWGADPSACAAGYVAGAAYAAATDAVVLDCEEGKLLSPARTAEVARDITRSLPAIEAVVQRAIDKYRARFRSRS